MGLVLTLHAAATWYMVGLIWLIQIVHYPMFEFFDSASFKSTHTFHSTAITFVVMPAMLLKLALAAVILWQRGPLNAPALVGFGLVVLIWMATFFVLVPLHGRLQTNGFQPQIHASLCRRNWLRTIAWSARGVIVASRPCLRIVVLKCSLGDDPFRFEHTPGESGFKRVLGIGVEEMGD